MSNKTILSIIVIILLFISCKKEKNTLGSKEHTAYADSIFIIANNYQKEANYRNKAILLYNDIATIYKINKKNFKYAKVLQNLAYTYYYKGKYDSVIYYQKKAANIFSKIKKQKFQAIAYNYIGIAFTILGDLDSAIIYYNKGIELTKQTKDTLEFIELYQNKGITYSYEGNYKYAINNTIKALKFAEIKEYTNNIIALNIHIAQFYNEIDNREKTLSYLKNAENFLDKCNNYETKASLFNTFGEFYIKQNEYSKAEKEFKKTLSISKKNNYKIGLAAAYGNLALIAIKNKYYKKAEEYANLSLNTEKESDNLSGIVSSLITLSEIKLETKKYKESTSEIIKAEKISKENYLMNFLPDIYYQYYQIYKEQNKNDSAIYYLERYYNIKDTLLNNELKEKITNIDIKYQSEKKQHKINILKEENKTNEQKIKNRNLFILSLLLLTIIFLGITYVHRQNAKNALNKINMQLQQYILQINEFNKNKETAHKKDIESIAKKYKLTEREAEILRYISEGKSNQEIANLIFVSLNTVKFHIKNIYIKLDVKNRVEARNKIA